MGSRGGGERAERQRWDGMCECGDDRWGPIAGWTGRNSPATNCTPHPQRLHDNWYRAKGKLVLVFKRFDGVVRWSNMSETISRF